MPLEYHYTHKDLAQLLGFQPKSVARKIARGEFGEDVILDGQIYLVPESGVELYRKARRVFQGGGATGTVKREVERVIPEVHPLAARTVGELRRKARGREAGRFLSGVQTCGTLEVVA